MLTEAWNLARRHALQRLREEALQVGADAVVGVHLHRGEHDLGRRTIDYVVTGTAIRLPDSTPSAQPVLTDASVQDYWQLHSAGHEPVGLVATTAVVFASPPRATRIRRLRTIPRNQELEELSGGFQAAREAVRVRLRGQVADAHAAGAVGVSSRTRCTARSLRWPPRCSPAAIGAGAEAAWGCPTSSPVTATPSVAAG